MVLKMPALEVQDRLDCLQRTHFKSSFWSYKPLKAAYSKTKSFLSFGKIQKANAFLLLATTWSASSLTIDSTTSRMVPGLLSPLTRHMLLGFSQ